MALTPQPGSNIFSTDSVGNLNGFFKQIYADKLKDLIPDGVKLLNMAPFIAKEKQGGNSYNQAVILGLEHGITFGSSTDDAFSLEAPISGVVKNAEVRGNPVVLRSLLGYTAASRAQSSAQAFEDATKYIIANMLRSMAKKLEIELFHGKRGYGVIDSVLGLVITIETSEWAPGIWAGAEKMVIQIRDATGATARGTATVTAVDMVNRTITVDALPGGTVATDVIWHKGAYGNEFAGLHEIIKPSTATLFGINTNDYQLFKGNVYDAGGAALSFTKLNLAASRAVEKGLDGKLVFFVNPRAWANILSDQAGLRMYDGSYSKKRLENGAESIMFYSQNGEMEIIPSIFVKEGYAYGVSMDDLVRVGSSEMTFSQPGMGQEQVFQKLEGVAGYEIKLWADQALFHSAPGKCVLIENIVNSN